MMDLWPARRDRYLEAHPSCVVCDSCNPFYNILVHHLSYQYPRGKEPDSDLVTLCSSDHRRLHEDYQTAIRRRYGGWVPSPVWESHLRDFSIRWIIQAHTLLNRRN